MYRGRFAPSPTGPLHFGSLLAACASYLEARSRGGQWLLRIEDLDPSRCRPEYTAAILDALSRFGFNWDEEVIYQSDRTSVYAAAFERLGDLTYPCCCSRREIAGLGEASYPGTCRAGMESGKPVRAYRLRVPEQTILIRDRLQGDLTFGLNGGEHDFVIRRGADGSYAYQLAVVVDDYEQGITHIVRGADLIHSTPRQIVLQRLLGYPQPSYMHIPVALGREGDKLSKQTLAPALDPQSATSLLLASLRFLGQNPSLDLEREDCGRIWQWAIENWDATKIPAVPALPAP